MWENSINMLTLVQTWKISKNEINIVLINVIQKLKQAQIKKESSGFIDIIHFNDMDEVKLANPYLSNLGVISHRCDQGKKIVFKVSNFREWGRPSNTNTGSIPSDIITEALSKNPIRCATGFSL